MRLPGLIKIVRLLKLRRTLRKWNSLSYGPLLKVITIICGWLLVAHWFACGWFILGERSSFLSPRAAAADSRASAS